MKKLVLLSAMAVMLSNMVVMAQPPDTLWTRTYNNSYSNNEDYGRCVQQTTDGGYIITGYSYFNFSDPDIWLIKTDANGDTLWTRVFDGGNYDMGYAVQQTTDGGYIITGCTYFDFSNPNIWLIKTDANGDTLWTKTYNNGGNDIGYDAQQTTDGGYIIVGNTSISIYEESDIWLLKTDANGDTLWTRTFSGENYGYDWGHSVQQTTDSGYIIAGSIFNEPNNRDIWLIKTDANGDTLWTRVFDDGNYDIGYDAQQTTDGGYITVGVGRNTTYPNLYSDIWLIKTDANGDTLWVKILDRGFDQGYSVEQTLDGGYIVAGSTYIIDNHDVWLIKTDANGDTLWTQIIGGSGEEEARHIQQTLDGGYIITGWKVPSPLALIDVYLVRLEPEYTITLTPVSPPIQIPPNGGSFSFEMEVENNTINPMNWDVWTEAILPDGQSYGPIILLPNVLVQPDTLLMRSLTQYVPPRALAGQYWYKAYLGEYPNTIVSTDSFSFEKLPGEGEPSHNFGWQLFGWDEEIPQTTILPTEARLHPATPNPFNPTTTLSFTLPQLSRARLVIYNLQGQEVVRLLDKECEAGTHQLVFDASNLTSGIYLARLSAGHSSQTQKLLLVK